VWSALLFAVILFMIAIEAFKTTSDSTLRLKNGKQPVITLAPEHNYHTFVSHIWGSGQDQVRDF